MGVYDRQKPFDTVDDAALQEVLNRPVAPYVPPTAIILTLFRTGS